MGKELAPEKAAEKALQRVKFDDVVITVDDVREYLCQKATPKEIFMAMGIMASYKLNPFKREVHLIKYGDSPAQVVVGYETYLKRAERTEKLNGWKAWIDKTANRACLLIHRKDWTEPFEWYVELTEFDKKQSTWKQIPDFMGKKVVIAQGFRICFPDELGGMPYTKEEQEVYDITDEGHNHAGKPVIEGEIKPLRADTPETPEKPAEPPADAQDEAPDEDEPPEQPPLPDELDGMPGIVALTCKEFKKDEIIKAVWGRVVSIKDKQYNDKKYWVCHVFEPGTEATAQISSFLVPEGVKQGDILIFADVKPGKTKGLWVAGIVKVAA